MRRSRLLLVSIALVVAGCTASEPASRDVPLPTSDVLPRLTRVHVPGLDSVGPELKTALVAVSARGTLLFTSGFDTADRLFTAVDAGGRVIARFGRTGSGPGEFRAPSEIRIVADTAIILDQNLNRVVKMRLDGRHVRTSGVLPPSRILHLSPDSVDVIAGEVVGGTALDRLSLRTLRGRRLVVAPESLYADRVLRGVFSSAYGVSDEGILLGDPFTYRLQAYDHAGRPTYTIVRDVPPRRRTPDHIAQGLEDARRRERTGFVGPTGRRTALKTPPDLERRLATDTLRHFPANGSILADARGRTWIIGQVQDSTFVDIFARERFLGRLVLPCRGTSHPVKSLNGEWLALACLADEAELSREVELQLYRIEEE